MLPVLARGPALGLAGPFPFPFENGFQLAGGTPHSPLGPPTRGVSAALNLLVSLTRINP